MLVQEVDQLRIGFDRGGRQAHEFGAGEGELRLFAIEDRVAGAGQDDRVEREHRRHGDGQHSQGRPEVPQRGGALRRAPGLQVDRRIRQAQRSDGDEGDGGDPELAAWDRIDLKRLGDREHRQKDPQEAFVGRFADSRGRNRRNPGQEHRHDHRIAGRGVEGDRHDVRDRKQDHEAGARPQQARPDRRLVPTRQAQSRRQRRRRHRGDGPVQRRPRRERERDLEDVPDPQRVLHHPVVDVGRRGAGQQDDDEDRDEGQDEAGGRGKHPAQGAAVAFPPCRPDRAGGDQDRRPGERPRAGGIPAPSRGGGRDRGRRGAARETPRPGATAATACGGGARR